MRPKLKRPLRSYTRVLLAQRTSSGIARIGKEFRIRSALSLIECLKISAAHIDLAAHFEDIRRIA